MASTSQSAVEYIRNARCYLVGELRSLSVILENLYQQKVLNDEEVSKIKAEIDDYDRTRSILDSVTRKGEAASYKLLRIIDTMRKRTLERTPLPFKDRSGSKSFDLNYWISCFSFKEDAEMDAKYLQGPRPCHSYQRKLKLKAEKQSKDFWRKSENLFENNKRPDLSYTPLVLNTKGSISPSKIKKYKLKKSKMRRPKKLRTYIPEDTSEISPSDLLKTDKNLLLVGKPGIGKTALTHEIMRLWSERDNKDLDYMFYFDMRETTNITTMRSLEDLLFSEYTKPDEGKDEVLQDIESNSENVTIIFDGVTDLPSSVVKKLVDKDLLPNAKIIITCRPDDEDDFTDEDFLQVEVKGFSEKMIKRYLSTILGEDHNKVLSNLELLTLCHVPMYALMVAVSFSSGDSLQPTTATEIYINIVRFSLQMNSNKTKTKNLNPFIKTKRQEILSLAEAAFKACERKTVNLEDLTCEDSFVLSILKPLDIKVAPTETITVHAFLHYTMQEFFAALWLLENPVKIRDVFQQCLTEEMKHMKHLIPFMCRLLNEKSPRLMSCFIPAEELKKTSDWFFKEMITTFTSQADDDDEEPYINTVFLYQCLFESQSPEACVCLLDKLDYHLDLSGEDLDPYSCCAVTYVVTQSKERKIRLNLQDVTASEQGMRQLLGCLRNVQWCERLPQQLWKIVLLSEGQMENETLLHRDGKPMHLPVMGKRQLFERAVRVIRRMTTKVNVCLYWDRGNPDCQIVDEYLFEVLQNISSLRFKPVRSDLHEQTRFLVDLFCAAAERQQQTGEKILELLVSVCTYQSFPLDDRYMDDEYQSDFLLDLFSQLKDCETKTGLSLFPLHSIFQSAPAVWTIKLSERKTSILLEVLKLQSEKKPVKLTGCSHGESEVRSFLQCLPHVSQIRFLPQVSEASEEIRFLRSLFCAVAQGERQTGETILEHFSSVYIYKSSPLKEKWVEFLLDLLSYDSKTGLSVLPSSQRKIPVPLEVPNLKSERKHELSGTIMTQDYSLLEWERIAAAVHAGALTYNGKFQRTQDVIDHLYNYQNTGCSHGPYQDFCFRHLYDCKNCNKDTCHLRLSRFFPRDIEVDRCALCSGLTISYEADGRFHYGFTVINYMKPNEPATSDVSLLQMKHLATYHTPYFILMITGHVEDKRYVVHKNPERKLEMACFIYAQFANINKTCQFKPDLATVFLMVWWQYMSKRGFTEVNVKIPYYLETTTFYNRTWNPVHESVASRMSESIFRFIANTCRCYDIKPADDTPSCAANKIQSCDSTLTTLDNGGGTVISLTTCVPKIHVESIMDSIVTVHNKLSSSGCKTPHVPRLNAIILEDANGCDIFLHVVVSVEKSWIPLSAWLNTKPECPLKTRHTVAVNIVNVLRDLYQTNKVPPTCLYKLDKLAYTFLVNITTHEVSSLLPYVSIDRLYWSTQRSSDEESVTDACCKLLSRVLAAESDVERCATDSQDSNYGSSVEQIMSFCHKGFTDRNTWESLKLYLKDSRTAPLDNPHTWLADTVSDLNDVHHKLEELGLQAPIRATVIEIPPQGRLYSTSVPLAITGLVRALTVSPAVSVPGIAQGVRKRSLISKTDSGVTELHRCISPKIRNTNKPLTDMTSDKADGTLCVDPNNISALESLTHNITPGYTYTCDPDLTDAQLNDHNTQDSLDNFTYNTKLFDIDTPNEPSCSNVQQSMPLYFTPVENTAKTENYQLNDPNINITNDSDDNNLAVKNQWDTVNALRQLSTNVERSKVVAALENHPNTQPVIGNGQVNHGEDAHRHRCEAIHDGAEPQLGTQSMYSPGGHAITKFTNVGNNQQQQNSNDPTCNIYLVNTTYMSDEPEVKRVATENDEGFLRRFSKWRSNGIPRVELEDAMFGIQRYKYYNMDYVTPFTTLQTPTVDASQGTQKPQGSTPTVDASQSTRKLQGSIILVHDCIQNVPQDPCVYLPVITDCGNDVSPTPDPQDATASTRNTSSLRLLRNFTCPEDLTYTLQIPSVTLNCLKGNRVYNAVNVSAPPQQQLGFRHVRLVTNEFPVDNKKTEYKFLKIFSAAGLYLGHVMTIHNVAGLLVHRLFSEQNTSILDIILDMHTRLQIHPFVPRTFAMQLMSVPFVNKGATAIYVGESAGVFNLGHLNQQNLTNTQKCTLAYHVTVCLIKAQIVTMAILGFPLLRIHPTRIWRHQAGFRLDFLACLIDHITVQLELKKTAKGKDAASLVMDGVRAINTTLKGLHIHSFVPTWNMHHLNGKACVFYDMYQQLTGVSISQGDLSQLLGGETYQSFLLSTKDYICEPFAPFTVQIHNQYVKWNTVVVVEPTPMPNALVQTPLLTRKEKTTSKKMRKSQGNLNPKVIKKWKPRVCTIDVDKTLCQPSTSADPKVQLERVTKPTESQHRATALCNFTDNVERDTCSADPYNSMMMCRSVYRDM